MAILRQDNFNRANATLSGTTPSDGGSAWASALGNLNIVSQGCQNLSGGTAWLYLESSASDVEVQLTFAAAGAGTNAGQIFRLVDSNNFWFVGGLGSSYGSVYELSKYVGGSYSQVQTWATAPANNDVVKVVANGTSIKLYVNGVERISITSSDHQSGTKHGIRFASEATSVVDDFSITEISGSTAKPGYYYAQL